MQAAAAAAAAPPATPLIKKPELQSRLFYLIKLIQNAIYDRQFVELLQRVVKISLDHPGNFYRFFMRGSSAAAFYTEDITNIYIFPKPFTSDIDMMMLVNPELPGPKFNAIRGLLFKKILDTILEFTRTDAVQYLDDIWISKDLFDADELKPDAAAPKLDESKRNVSISTPSLFDADPVNTIFRLSDQLKVGQRSMFKVAIANDIIYPVNGQHELQNNSLISIIPRVLGAKPVFEISFPKLNFLEIPAKVNPHSRIYYEWIETNNHAHIKLEIPQTRKREFYYENALFKTRAVGTGKFPEDKELTPTGKVPLHKDKYFTLTVPILSRQYAEIDAETSLATTENPEKRARRAAMADKLRKVIRGY